MANLQRGESGVAEAKGSWFDALAASVEGILDTEHGCARFNPAQAWDPAVLIHVPGQLAKILSTSSDSFRRPAGLSPPGCSVIAQPL